MNRWISACLAILCFLCIEPAPAKELKLATIAPDGSGWMERMREAADRVETRTDGSVRIRFFPGGVMGDASAVLRRMRMGQLHGGAFTLGELASVAPEANLYSMPFVFRNLEEVRAVRRQFDPIIMEALAEGGMIVPGISLGGFAYLFSDRELPTADPDGIGSAFRIWVPAGDRLSQRTLEAAGATPVPLPLAEVYTALQTGAVNTFASTTSATIILQWHTRARMMLDMPLLMTAGTIGLDQRAVDGLDRGHREILLEELAGAIERIEQDNLADNAEALSALTGEGVRIASPEPDVVRHWHELAREIRRRAMAAGDVDLPHLDRLESRLEEMRARQ